METHFLITSNSCFVFLHGLVNTNILNFQWMCTIGLKFLHHICVHWNLQSICDVTSHAHIGLLLKIRFSLSTEKIYTFSNECKNNLIVSLSASLSTINFKHSTGGARRKTQLWLERDFKKAQNAVILGNSSWIQLILGLWGESLSNGLYLYQAQTHLLYALILCKMCWSVLFCTGLSHHNVFEHPLKYPLITAIHMGCW